MKQNHERLANQVALRLDNWREGDGCPAWIESTERTCGRPNTIGYLCKRHHTVAARKLEKHLAEVAERTQKRLELRRRQLPKWKEQLAKVNAEIERRDKPVVADRAAVGGNTHPSIWKKQKAALSDSNVKRMAELWRKHEELTRLIGHD